MTRFRRRLVSAFTTFAFGLGVTMAGSLGAASSAITVAAVPAATLVQPRRGRRPFAAPAAPTEPFGRPAPPAWLASVPQLEALQRRPRSQTDSVCWEGILVLTAVLATVALLTWPIRCADFWDGWFVGESCAPRVRATVPLAIATVVWAGGVALMVPQRRR